MLFLVSDYPLANETNIRHMMIIYKQLYFNIKSLKHEQRTKYLNVLELTNLEVTECNPWKSSRFLCNSFFCQTIDSLNSPHLEKSTQESVEKEEMRNDIDHIQQLDEQVQTSQKCSLTFVTEKAESWGSLAQAHKGIPVVLTIGFKPAIHVQAQVFHSLVPFLLVSNLSGSRHLNQLVHVYTGVTGKHAPQETWEFEEEGHEEQDEWYPLVVGELVLMMAVVVRGDCVMHRNVICILDPAVGLCISHIGTWN